MREESGTSSRSHLFLSGLMYIVADIKARGETKKKIIPTVALKNSAAYLRVLRLSVGIILRARLSGCKCACRRPCQSLAERGGVQPARVARQLNKDL